MELTVEIMSNIKASIEEDVMSNMIIALCVGRLDASHQFPRYCKKLLIIPD